MTDDAVLVPFDDTFRDLSFDWLHDPEIARLTRAAAFDRDSQLRWWSGLGSRSDYAIWGIRAEGRAVGAVGLKKIGVDEGAECFLYIGERAYWRRGLGSWAVEEMCREIAERGLTYAYAVVGKDNTASLAVFVRAGFEIVREDDETVTARRLAEHVVTGR